MKHFGKISVLLSTILCFLFLLTSCSLDHMVHEFSEEWSNDDGTHWHECSCGEKSDLGNHVFDEWKKVEGSTALEEQRSCTICGYVQSRTNDDNGNTGGDNDDNGNTGGDNQHTHVFGLWQVTKEPTETTKGQLTRVCSDCNENETHELPVLNDNDYVLKTEDATCVDNGLKTYVYNLGDQNFSFEVVINALGHVGTGECEICHQPLVESLFFENFVQSFIENPIALNITKYNVEIADNGHNSAGLMHVKVFNIAVRLNEAGELEGYGTFEFESESDFLSIMKARVLITDGKLYIEYGSEYEITGDTIDSPYNPSYTLNNNGGYICYSFEEVLASMNLNMGRIESILLVVEQFKEELLTIYK